MPSTGTPSVGLGSAGKHAWDERDAGSIATHTPSYRSVIEAERLAAEAEQPRPNTGFSATARLASAMMARMRGRGPAAALRG